MAEHLKCGASTETKADSDRNVRDTVKGILADIGTRGDAVIRELSKKFDGWDRDSYRLTGAEIQGCIDQLAGQDLKEIEFAQAQVRNFAQIPRASMIKPYVKDPAPKASVLSMVKLGPLGQVEN